MKILVCMTWQAHTDVIRIIWVGWGGESFNSLMVTVREGPLQKTSLYIAMNKNDKQQQKQTPTSKLRNTDP